jgi:uncharacterized phage-like protein YoqJ
LRLTVAGHRPPKVGGYRIPNPVFTAVVKAMDEMLMQLRPEVIYTGMALGVDQWAAALAHDNDIPFIAAIPMDGYDSRWPEESQRQYRDLLALAHEIVVVSPGIPYRPELMAIRNTWMVTRSDAVMAVWNGSPGSGTSSCIVTAQHLGKQIYRVPVPNEIWRLAAGIHADEEDRRARFQQRQNIIAAEQQLTEFQARARAEEEAARERNRLRAEHDVRVQEIQREARERRAREVAERQMIEEAEIQELEARVRAAERDVPVIRVPAQEPKKKEEIDFVPGRKIRI